MEAGKTPASMFAGSWKVAAMDVSKVDSGPDYKQLDEGKWVRVEGWRDTEAAKAEIMASVEMYQNAPERPNF